MENVTVSAIYCDDIRPEIGGKFSYMGVYNSDLVLLELPVQIAKLCIQVIIRLPIETAAQNLTVGVLNNGASLAEIALPEGQLQSMRKLFAETDDAVEESRDDKQLTCQLALQFPNLELASGAIRLRIVVDGVEYKGNALRIRLATAEEREKINLN